MSHEHSFKFWQMKDIFQKPYAKDWISWFGIANYELFFISSVSEAALLQLFLELQIAHTFHKTITRFLKLTNLQWKEQPKHGLIKLLPSLFIALGWNVIKHLIWTKQLCFCRDNSTSSQVSKRDVIVFEIYLDY